MECGYECYRDWHDNLHLPVRLSIQRDPDLQIARLPDPRTSGSGNPGATNVLRLGGKLAAASVMVFDILKGMIPVWIGYGLGLPPFWLGLVEIAAWPYLSGVLSLSRLQRGRYRLGDYCAHWL